MAGSMRQRGPSSWELRVHVGRDPDTGAKQYATKTVRGTKREAEKELARLVAQVDDGQVTGKVASMAELCEAWYAQHQPDWSPTTAEGYRAILDRHVLPRWGEVTLRRIRTSDLDRWYSQLRKSGGAGGRPLSSSSVKRIHAVVHVSLEQSLRWGWLTINPASHARPPIERKAKLKYVIPGSDDVARLVAAAEAVNPGLPAFLRLAATSGARRGELCALRWKSLDLEEGVVLITRALVETKHGGVIEKDTKTHADRRVSLDPGTVDVLRTHQERCRNLAQECGGELVRDAFVFSHEVDGSVPWRPGYTTLAFHRLRKELGLDGVRLHDLRHFNATLLLAAGTDIRTVSGRLGHSDASTTLDIYAHFVRQADQAAANAIGALLDGGRS